MSRNHPAGIECPADSAKDDLSHPCHRRKRRPFRDAFPHVECVRRLFRQLVVDAGDVEVHAKERAVIGDGTFGEPIRTVLLLDRAGEGVQFAGADLRFGLFGELLHVVGHVGVGRHRQDAVLQAIPDLLRLPGAVEHGLGALDVVGAPGVDDGGELGVRAGSDHVGRLAERLDATLGGDLHRRGRVRVLGQDVDALVDQRLGGVGFLAGVEPGVGPDDLDLEVRVHRLRAMHEGIDAHDDFRDREGGDVACDTLLGHLGGDQALDVAAFIKARIVGRDIRGGLEARRVLELHVRELFSDLDGGIHEAERGGEDQRAAGAGHALDRALGVGAFRNAFEEGRLDLVAEFLLQRLAADIVRLRPAAIRLGADIDEADLRLILGAGCGG